MLYTGKGDNGTTRIFACGERIPKSAQRIEALGNLDELNSLIGFCAALAQERLPELEKTLRKFQQDLFTIQAAVAGAPKKLREEALSELEAFVSKVEREIEPIHSFIVPGATIVSGSLDLARSLARRTERSVVVLSEENKNDSYGHLLPYLNRLSSALFAAARLAAKRAGAKEEHPSY